MTSRDVIVREYLRQQANMINGDEFTDNLTNDGQINVHHNHQMVVSHSQQPSSEEELAKFKEEVKSWLKLDNEVKAINAKIKILDNERKHRKKLIDVFSANILSFMSSNEIDELNSKDGIIKYKKSMVKKPLTQKEIKQKLKEQFQNIMDSEQIIETVFKGGEKVPKVTLKRSS
jgi:hypothetical protein